jgi:phosphonate transport system substrate-binding protein
MRVIGQLNIVSLMADNAAPTYRAIAAYLSQRLGLAVQLVEDVPWQQREQLLDAGLAQVGFICGLPYVQKHDRAAPLVELLAAPVMAAERYGGQPIYFSDVVVRHDSPLHSFADLRGARWAYNEPGSHSGYNITCYHLASLGEREGYFGQAIASGAHLASLAMVLDGTVDATAIDSIVLEAELRRRPELRVQLRTIAALGPSPLPPVVASRVLPDALRKRLQEELLALHVAQAGRELLAQSGIARFVAVADADYNPLRRMLRDAEGVALAPALRA